MEDLYGVSFSILMIVVQIVLINFAVSKTFD